MTRDEAWQEYLKLRPHDKQMPRGAEGPYAGAFDDGALALFQRLEACGVFTAAGAVASAYAAGVRDCVLGQDHHAGQTFELTITREQAKALFLSGAAHFTRAKGLHWADPAFEAAWAAVTRVGRAMHDCPHGMACDVCG